MCFAFIKLTPICFGLSACRYPQCDRNPFCSCSDTKSCLRVNIQQSFVDCVQTAKLHISQTEMTLSSTLLWTQNKHCATVNAWRRHMELGSPALPPVTDWSSLHTFLLMCAQNKNVVYCIFIADQMSPELERMRLSLMRWLCLRSLTESMSVPSQQHGAVISYMDYITCWDVCESPC